MNLLIIEDDATLQGELSALLTAYGYECSYPDDFARVVEQVKERTPDLILLDINLPYYDGYHICREIRKFSRVPIIIMTSRNTDMDELMSLNLGADDFIAKPFNRRILLARIAAVLNRSGGQAAAETMSCRGLTLSLVKSAVSFNGATEELTKNELHILSVLMKNSGRIVSRDELMNELWQSDEFVDDNTLTVNVNRLRQKLKAIGAGDPITTRRGQGYLL